MGEKKKKNEWGKMIEEERELIMREWWVVKLKGIEIIINVIEINMIGEGMRDEIDKKIKRS